MALANEEKERQRREAESREVETGRHLSDRLRSENQKLSVRLNATLGVLEAGRKLQAMRERKWNQDAKESQKLVENLRSEIRGTSERVSRQKEEVDLAKRRTLGAAVEAIQFQVDQLLAWLKAVVIRGEAPPPNGAMFFKNENGVWIPNGRGREAAKVLASREGVAEEARNQPQISCFCSMRRVTSSEVGLCRWQSWLNVENGRLDL